MPRGRVVVRIVGLGASVVLLVSVLLVPFSGSKTLASDLPVSRLLEIMNQTSQIRYDTLISIVGAIGTLFIILGSLIGLYFFGARFRKSTPFSGMILAIAGVVFVSVYYWPNLSSLGLGYSLSWGSAIVGLVASRLAPTLSHPAVVAPGGPPAGGREVVAKEILTSEDTKRITQTEKERSPTGYEALDKLLLGGLPTGTSVILTGPSYDERDLIVTRFIETDLSSGNACIYIGTSLDRVKNLISQYGQTLQVILCHPQAETMAKEFPQVEKLKSIEDPSAINIEFGKADGNLPAGKTTVLCIEIIGEVLLRRGGATTRKWLMDFLGRTKSSHITTLATFNPSMHSSEDAHLIIDSFDGQVELKEEEVLARRARTIRVVKLSGKQFIEKDLLVEKTDI